LFYLSQRKRDVVKKKVRKICARCGKHFYSSIGNAKYCHNPCRLRARVAKKKERERTVWTDEMNERWNMVLQDAEGVKRLENLITSSTIKKEIRKRRAKGKKDIKIRTSEIIKQKEKRKVA
jgi:hypothetical protein